MEMGRDLKVKRMKGSIHPPKSEHQGKNLREDSSFWEECSGMRFLEKLIGEERGEIFF